MRSTTSPLSSKTRRKTPCAAGCCGPKFIVKFRVKASTIVASTTARPTHWRPVGFYSTALTGLKFGARLCLLWVKSRHSALPHHVRFALESGHCDSAAHVRFVPEADSCTAAKNVYSITSSARMSSVGGMMIPSALAVWRLIIIVSEDEQGTARLGFSDS